MPESDLPLYRGREGGTDPGLLSELYHHTPAVGPGLPPVWPGEVPGVRWVRGQDTLGARTAQEMGCGLCSLSWKELGPSNVFPPLVD